MEKIEQNFSLESLPYLNDEGVECIEKWLPVKGFEKYYEVSDLGRFRTFDRVITRYNGVKEYKPARILKNLYYSNGYCQLMFYVEKTRSTFIAHRVVAEHFIENKDNLPFVNHKNCKKDDNRAENLEWCTRKENVKHAVENGRFLIKNSAQGSKCANSKLNEEEVRYIRLNYKKDSIKELYLEFKDKISYNTFKKIGQGLGWAHVTIH